LDNILVQEYEGRSYPSLYAAAGYNRQRSEVVLAVANPTADRMEAAIGAKGGRFTGAGTAEVLAASDPSAENSLKDPRRIAPQAAEISLAAEDGRYVFPAYSFTVLKLPTEQSGRSR
jgi:alpha-L-arabinofuranosidase